MKTFSFLYGYSSETNAYNLLGLSSGKQDSHLLSSPKKFNKIFSLLKVFARQDNYLFYFVYICSLLYIYQYSCLVVGFNKHTYSFIIPKQINFDQPVSNINLNKVKV